MSPHEYLAIATAALRWSTAYERRRAAGAEKRQADDAYRSASMPVTSGALGRAVDASRRVTELKRQERAAQRALAKLCADLRAEQSTPDATKSLVLEMER